MSDTPRTDYAESMASKPILFNGLTEVVTLKGLVSSAFAREMERELAAANAEIDRLQVAGIHSCHHECQRPLCKLRREHNVLVDALEKIASGVYGWGNCVDVIAPNALALVKGGSDE
jgi:hypothetical protein